MTLKNLIILMFAFIILNKILKKLMAYSETFKKKKRLEKIIIGSKSVALYEDKKFQELTIDYLKNRGISSIEIETDNVITGFEDNKKVIIFYKQIKKTEEVISDEEIISCVGKAKLIDASKYFIITNGEVPKELKVILSNVKNIEIKIIESFELIKAFRNLSEKNLGMR